MGGMKASGILKEDHKVKTQALMEVMPPLKRSQRNPPKRGTHVLFAGREK
jgi:hypothetical protein